MTCVRYCREWFDRLVANIASSSENKVEKGPAAPVPSDQPTLI